ncbi:hypothetical protein CR513_21774, partial [Mucuna pruriens]
MPQTLATMLGWCCPTASCLTNDVNPVSWFSNLRLSTTNFNGGGSQAHKATAKKDESDHPRRGQERGDKNSCCRDHLPHLRQPVLANKRFIPFHRTNLDDISPSRGSWPDRFVLGPADPACPTAQ